MIDYHAHVAGLATIRADLDAATNGTAQAAAWADIQGAIAAEPGSALLGALFDHLLERAEGAEPEINFLETAAALYKESADALTVVAKFRAEFEPMVASPATASFENFTALLGQIQALQPKLLDLKARFEAFRPRVSPPFLHVTLHAGGASQPVSNWAWRDVVLSRRTDALITALQDATDGTARTRAFAFGALACYAANTVGSGYVAQTVRGPRRSHPIRDRVARYAVGAWLRKHEAALCPSLSEIRARLADQLGATLPEALRTQIVAALGATFPTRAPAVLPDLDGGYTTLLHHLELLESFQRVPAPADFDPLLIVKVLDNPAASKAYLKPQDIFRPDPPDPTLPPDPTPTPGSDRTGDAGCGAVILAILLAVTIIGLMIYKMATGRWPWETAPQNPPSSSSAAALTTFLESDDALIAAAGLYNAHCALYEAMNLGLHYLKQVGLVYPDDIDLSESAFSQFTELTQEPGYPHRPTSDLNVGYLDPPSTPIEDPGTTPSPYPTGTGSTPAVFLRGVPGISLPTVGSAGTDLWLKHQNPTGERVNLNADADRGFGHLCWRVNPGTTLLNNPVSITDLGYGEVN